MPYLILADEVLEDALRRIAVEQIDRAVAEIDDAALPDDATVHQVRKRCKKGRGLVFIAEPGQPVVIRGGKTASGVTAAGRAETAAEAIGSARFMLSSDLLARALPALKGDVALSALAEGARVEPIQQDAHLNLSAVLMGIRASAEELQDV